MARAVDQSRAKLYPDILEHVRQANREVKLYPEMKKQMFHSSRTM